PVEVRDSAMGSRGLSPRTAALAVAIALPISILSGCGPSKVAECNRLVTVVNQGVASLDQGMKATSDPTGVAELRSMADAMERAAGDAGKVELTIPELKDFSTRYQGM